MSQLSDDELKKLVESNARAIEALANTMAENERKSEGERARVREEMALAREERAQMRKEMAEFREIVADAIQNLSHGVAHLDNSLAKVARAQVETIGDTYRVINKLEARQGEIVDVLKLLSKRVVGDKNED